MRAAAGMAPKPAAERENNLRPRDLPRCCFVLAQALTLRHGPNTLHCFTFAASARMCSASHRQPADRRRTGSPRRCIHAARLYSGRSFLVSPFDEDARGQQHNSKSNETKSDSFCLMRFSWNGSKVVFRGGSSRSADARPNEQIDGQRVHYPRQRGSDENQKHARSYRPSTDAHRSNV